MKIVICSLESFALLFVQSVMATVVVVGHPTNSSVLNEDEVQKIFLGKSRHFGNGQLAKPLDQAEGREPRQEFIETILHKTEAALKSYWSTLLFTGNGVPPDVFSDDQTIKNYISSNPNAIGYVDSRSVDKTVKVLFKP